MPAQRVLDIPPPLPCTILALTYLPIDALEVPAATSLTPSQPDCVEVSPVRIVGGVRPQNFYVGYRPDGVRFAFDSKTLNDSKSVGKNWQNMIHDLSTEAVTAHSRFPHAGVAFIVIVPEPCLGEPQRSAMVETLEPRRRQYQPQNSWPSIPPSAV